MKRGHSWVALCGMLFSVTCAEAFDLEDDFALDSAGRRIRRVTSNFTYRGVKTFRIFIFVSGGPERCGPCVSASSSLAPSFIRIDGQLAPE